MRRAIADVTHPSLLKSCSLYYTAKHALIQSHLEKQATATSPQGELYRSVYPLHQEQCCGLYHKVHKSKKFHIGITT